PCQNPSLLNRIAEHMQDNDCLAEEAERPLAFTYARIETAERRQGHTLPFSIADREPSRQSTVITIKRLLNVTKVGVSVAGVHERHCLHFLTPQGFPKCKRVSVVDNSPLCITERIIHVA